LGALEAAKQLGYLIPQDISIVGFDDIDEAALTSPQLTTIHLSPRYVGNVAAETLLERLQGRQEPRHTLIKGSLIIQQYTAEPTNLVGIQTKKKILTQSE
jgi:LacI family transcriptional regulator